MKSQLTMILSLPLICLGSQNSFAGMRTTESLSEGAASRADVKKNSSGEACIIPAKYGFKTGTDGASISKFSDKDIEKEKKLCEIDFNTQPLCPKLNSTNPGVLVVETGVDGPKKSQMNASVCKAKKLDGKELSIQAKFKQSITCSYAPSALAAYHLTRMMGGQLKTPVAVVKTMTVAEHQKVGAQALAALAGRPTELIYKSWAQFKARDSEKSEPKLYVDSGAFLFGALSDNVKRENNYTEVSGVGPYETRYERFGQQGPFKRVTNGASVESIIGSDKSLKGSFSIIQQMIDVSNMVVLDTLLSQDDRIGNIHFFMAFAAAGPDGKVHKIRLDKKDMAIVEGLAGGKPLSRLREADFISMTAGFLGKKPEVSKDSHFSPAGVLVREMVLKDNDCGVDVDKRSNKMRKISAIEAVRHITPATYRMVMALQKEVSDNPKDMNEFFVNTLLYRDADYTKSGKSFTDNLNKVASVLKANCKSGALKIDLVDSYKNGVYSAPGNNCL